MTLTTTPLDALILNLLRDHGLISGKRGWRVEPAAGGLNSRVYFVRHGGRTPVFTVRLAIEDRAWMLRREAKILRSIDQRCRCAPSTVALLESNDLPDGVLLVHAFAEGSTAPLGSVSEQRLRALGACLATLHAHTTDRYTVWPDLTPSTGTRATAYLDRLAAMLRYTTYSKLTGSSLKSRIDRVYHALAGIERGGAGWDDTSFSVLQGDTSIGNIIWNGDSVSLIDWEFARHGDPAEEIAYLLTEQPLSAESSSVLFQGYVDHGGEPGAIERAAHYAPLTALDSALWWGDYQTGLGADPSRSREVAMHLGRAEAALTEVLPSG